MKIRVYILTRGQTLNPPDKAVKDALHQLGFASVQALQLGRYFEFEVDDSFTADEWRERISEALKKPVTNFPNPVTEGWRMEIVP